MPCGNCNIGGKTSQVGNDTNIILFHQDYSTIGGETLQVERLANLEHLWYNSLGRFKYMEHIN